MYQLLLILILSLPKLISLDAKIFYQFKDEFVVWNVGQGLFTTESHSQYCLHFDIGGEFFPVAQVNQTCRNKRNLIHLSHLDWDHLSFAGYAAKNLKACLINHPTGQISSRKFKILAELPDCLFFTKDYFEYKPIEAKSLSSNDSSQVVLTKNHILISGDSTVKQEKIWSQKIDHVRIFVLGHHGSRTSNSDQVFKRMKQVSMAVASARKKRYGHPHSEVLAKAAKNKTPVLLTEDWGSLHFEI